MAQNLASKYQSAVDEAISFMSKTQGLAKMQFDFAGVNAVNVYSVATKAFNDYTMSGTSRYGTPTEVDDTVKTYTLSQDKSVAFTIDARNIQSKGGALAVAEQIARQTREQLIPMLDKYRIGVLYAKNTDAELTATEMVAAAPTKTTIVGLIQDATAQLDDIYESESRVIYMTPANVKLIKQSPEFMNDGLGAEMARRGVVGYVDGMPIIQVPSTYMNANCNFIIAEGNGLAAPVKLDVVRTHENPPGINGTLVEMRILHDFFIAKSLAKANLVCVKVAR